MLYLYYEFAKITLSASVEGLNCVQCIKSVYPKLYYPNYEHCTYLNNLDVDLPPAHTHTHTHAHTHTHTRTRTHTHKHMHTHKHTNTSLHKHAHPHIQTRTYKRTYTNTHTPTHTHKHTHTHTNTAYTNTYILIWTALIPLNQLCSSTILQHWYLLQL